MQRGEDSLVALCHAMSTLSTSGITPLVNFADAQAGAAGEMVLALFLTLAISRKLLLRLMGESHDNRLWRDDEVRLAMVLVLGVSAALFLWHLIGAASLGQAADLRAIGAALWGLFFTCFSFLTTTGFVSTHWAPTNLWSGLPATDMVLWSLAIVGGGVATTAGGVKLLRVLALLRYGEQELDRVVHPNSVPRRVDSGGLSRAAALQGTTMAWVFFMTFGLSSAAFAALLTLAGQSFDAALACPDVGPHLKIQRTRFFDATAFDRFYRDSTPEEFVQTFRDEVHHGVVDVHDADHSNKFARLNKVMQQAALLQASGVLGRHAGPQVKQGTCHLLANEGVMPWDR